MGVAFFAQDIPQEESKMDAPVAVEEAFSEQELEQHVEIVKAEEDILTAPVVKHPPQQEEIMTEEKEISIELSTLEQAADDPRIFGNPTTIHANEPVQVMNTEPEQEAEPELPTKWWGSTMFNDKRERGGFIMFMMPIVLMSVVSTLHLVDFFSIGTSPFLAAMLGIAFETASLATIVALVLLRKMNRKALWTIQILLYTLQIVGNIYAPFEFINPENATRLFEFFGLGNDVNAQRWVAVIQGAILPTVNLFLFKMTGDYFRAEK